MKLVVLDRDGVINADRDDYIRSVSDWHPLPGSLEAIARLCAAGFRVVVVSNQSAVARGYLDAATLEAIHQEMHRQTEAAGGRLAGIFVCPHGPDEGCPCRKPRPGLLHEVERRLGVSLAGVPMIGDKATDLEAARTAGCRPILVRTGKGAATEVAATGLAEATIFDDLAAAATHLIAEAEPATEATHPEETEST